ncbi:MAG: hypothetical protein KatS3mg109_0725 [Pirellulaceae bacterium]|nr:MAG: hypothetical protein KatS3mg109_0725 [Pirellulaceae bacterium]
MRRARYLIGLVMAVLHPVGDIWAQQETDSKQLVETIFAGWISRQHAIATLSARASVDVFYSRGYATNAAPTSAGRHRLVPPDDTWFPGGTQSWAIDFTRGRFRKEFYKAGIHSVDETIARIPPRILYSYQLSLFTGAKFTRVIRPEERDWPGSPPGFRQHVSFDHGIGHAFVIWPEDLPLLWCAGGTITGDWPNPLRLLKVDEPDQFTYYGHTDWHSRRCVLLRVRNQQSTDSVVEFWVDGDPPHAIYRSQIIRFVARGDRIERQIDVEYKELAGHLLPSKWQVTFYDYFGELTHQEKPFICMKTITIQDIEINRPLPEELFTVRLEPGMGVYDADNNRSFVVDLDGKLVPYQNPEQQRRIASLAKGRRTVQKVVSVVVGLAVAIALSTAGWLVYRRLSRRRRRT